MLDFVDDLPVVRDRYLAIMQARLMAEAERRPPLFPWESEVQDYPEVYDEPVVAQVPNPWLPQLRTLDIPNNMPEAVLLHVLERCQTLVGQVTQQGRALLEVVDALFPGQEALMNQTAGRLLLATGPGRKSLLTDKEKAEEEKQRKAREAIDYEQVAVEQQIALTMLAAQRLFGSLELELGTKKPRCDRQWLTAFGVLTLRAVYDRDRAIVALEGDLPCGGALTLETDGGSTVAHRTEAGPVALHWTEAHPQGLASLLVTFAVDGEVPPLRFAVTVKD
ncbi:MAG: hypothetical protein Fur0042_17210 [Cyanophyceae cyanobacterium]